MGAVSLPGVGRGSDRVVRGSGAWGGGGGAGDSGAEDASPGRSRARSAGDPAATAGETGAAAAHSPHHRATPAAGARTPRALPSPLPWANLKHSIFVMQTKNSVFAATFAE